MRIEAKEDKRAGRESLGPDFSVPRRFRAKITPELGDDLEYDVEFIARLQNGRMVVERFTAIERADGSPVTGDGIRTLPVATLLRLATRSLLARLEDDDDADTGAQVGGDGATQAELEFRQAAVARAYRIARLLGEAPLQSVADRFGVSRATAGRRVALARSEGLLAAWNEPEDDS